MDEDDELVLSFGCSECGAWIDTSSPEFEIEGAVLLCGACAARRLGKSNEASQKSLIPPNLLILPRSPSRA